VIVIGSAWCVPLTTIEKVLNPRLHRSILHNPEDYPEPERFLPERYLTPAGALDPAVRDPRTACFGFGRRICPEVDVTSGALCQPKPFPWSARPRSAQAEALLASAVPQ
jgi:hypothetical protein